MLTSRQKLILKSIIEEYIKTVLPVGSKYLTASPYLDYSSATIRNDMQSLEEYGFLEKTHISSGRVPSKAGYLYYIENLITVDGDIESYLPLFETIINRNGLTTDLAVSETINLLSAVTKYVVISVPSGEEQTISKIDLVPTSKISAVAVIVTSYGKVYYYNFSINDSTNLFEISKVANTLNNILVGKTFFEASNLLSTKDVTYELSVFMNYQNQIVESFIQAFKKFASEKVAICGMSNLFLHPEFKNSESLKKMYEVLEQDNLLKINFENNPYTSKMPNGINVLFYENYVMVSIPYYISMENKGVIVVVGPSRLDYKKTIPLLEYIASRLGELVKNEQK
jgi:heat-inducible transcriptional repressor